MTLCDSGWVSSFHPFHLVLLYSKMLFFPFLFISFGAVVRPRLPTDLQHWFAVRLNPNSGFNPATTNRSPRYFLRSCSVSAPVRHLEALGCTCRRVCGLVSAEKLTQSQQITVSFPSKDQSSVLLFLLLLPPPLLRAHCNRQAADLLAVCRRRNPYRVSSGSLHLSDQSLA